MPYQGHRCGHIVDYDGGWRIRDRDRNGGSCIVLADVIIMAHPVSCLHLIVVVDHNLGGS